LIQDIEDYLPQWRNGAAFRERRDFCAAPWRAKFRDRQASAQPGCRGTRCWMMLFLNQGGSILLHIFNCFLEINLLLVQGKKGAHATAMIKPMQLRVSPMV